MTFDKTSISIQSTQLKHSQNTHTLNIGWAYFTHTTTSWSIATR